MTQNAIKFNLYASSKHVKCSIPNNFLCQNGFCKHSNPIIVNLGIVGQATLALSHSIEVQVIEVYSTVWICLQKLCDYINKNKAFCPEFQYKEHN